LRRCRGRVTFTRHVRTPRAHHQLDVKGDSLAYSATGRGRRAMLAKAFGVVDENEAGCIRKAGAGLREAKARVVPPDTNCFISNTTYMADAPDSKSGPRKGVWVQVPPSVLATCGKTAPRVAMSLATIWQQDCVDIGVIQVSGSKSAAAATGPAKSLAQSRADKRVSDPKSSFCCGRTWNAYQRSVN
jgi:hypothetical protein